MRNTGRQPNVLRQTPHLDAWLAELAAALAGRGSKAELARFLAGGDELKVKAWIGRMGKWRRRETIPNGEDVLAVNAWLARRR